METPVEILYAGVIVGRSQIVRSKKGDDATYFLPTREPMPVGTVVLLRSEDGETQAQVVQVSEAHDPAHSGMRVRSMQEGEPLPDWGSAAGEIEPSVLTVERRSPTNPSLSTIADTRASSLVSDITPTPEIAIISPRPSMALALGKPILPLPAESPEPAQAIKPASPPAASEEKTIVAQDAPKASEKATPESVPVTVGASVTEALQAAASAASEKQADSTEVVAPSAPSPSAASENEAGGTVVAPMEDSSETQTLPSAKPLASGGKRKRSTKRRAK